MRPEKGGTGVPAEAFLYLILILCISDAFILKKQLHVHNLKHQTACLLSFDDLLQSFPSIRSLISLISMYAYKNIGGGRLRVSLVPVFTNF